MAEKDFLMDRGEEWDAQIEAAGIDQGWLDDGLWVGEDLADVAWAFGATFAAFSPSNNQGMEDMWIVTSHDGREVGLQLVHWHTPRGHVVWHSWNSIAVTPCPSESQAP